MVAFATVFFMAKSTTKAVDSKEISTRPTFEVSILEEVGGRLGWRVILNTGDVEEANSLVEAMQQDGVKVALDVIPAKR